VGVDIFTRKDAISGLKSSLWAGLSKLVNTPLDGSIFGKFHPAVPAPHATFDVINLCKAFFCHNGRCHFA
jgi:hypothetical protein